MKTSFAALALGLTALASTAQAACPTDLEAAAVAAAIVARQPVVAPAGEMSVEDGLCGRDKVLRFLAQTYGEATDALTLIPHMLAAFMARDRGFRKHPIGDRRKTTRSSPSVPTQTAT